MKNKKSNNKTSSGFKIPNTYFESFDDKLIAKLNEEEIFDTYKSSGFKAPSDYFESVDDKIISQLENHKNTKVVSLFSWKKAVFTLAVAASLILMFNVFSNTSEALTFDTLEIASIENYLSQEGFKSYEFASLLTEAELNSNTFLGTTISEDFLEDYLVENTNIEDLFIE